MKQMYTSMYNMYTDSYDFTNPNIILNLIMSLVYHNTYNILQSPKMMVW